MFSDKIVENLGKSSWIRAMFEEGARLKKIHGEDNVFDFSIGNPEFKAPKEVENALKFIASDDDPNKHRYMNNAGYPETRQAISNLIKKDVDIDIPVSNICMTCGAAGGLNVTLKALLNKDDEVIVFSPFFVEYLFYIENHNGKPVIVKTDENTFEPDIEELSKAINKKTKAILINTPNNPTGIIYSEKILLKIWNLLLDKEKELGTKIFIISDEPYSKIVYDNASVPSVLKMFNNSIVVNSFSKSHALPGERIGYIAVNPLIEEVETLMNCIVFCNRTLGFVNAPALQQHIIARAPDAMVDINEYRKRRDLLYNHLTELGFECIKPAGAFYLFPKSLEPDDVAFVKKAQEYNLLLVPGRGFGMPGHFRISYCVSIKTIENSLEAFTKLAKHYK
jgi:aspartate aminotransferase